MNPTDSVTRRHFLAGTLVTGLGTGVLLAPKATQAHAVEPISIPLPYASLNNGKPVLDIEDVREKADSQYFQGGCMHGAATGLG